MCSLRFSVQTLGGVLSEARLGSTHAQLSRGRRRTDGSHQSDEKWVQDAHRTAVRGRLLGDSTTDPPTSPTRELTRPHPHHSAIRERPTRGRLSHYTFGQREAAGDTSGEFQCCLQRPYLRHPVPVIHGPLALALGDAEPRTISWYEPELASALHVVQLASCRTGPSDAGYPLCRPHGVQSDLASLLVGECAIPDQWEHRKLPRPWRLDRQL